MEHGLEGFSIFDGLTQQQLSLIERHCKPISVQRGGEIFRAGDPAQCLFLVKAGGAELRFNVWCYSAMVEMPLDVVTAGDVLGWSALIPPYEYTLTAYASEDSELLQIERTHLRECCESDLGLGYAMMKNVAAIIGERYHRTRQMLGREIQSGLTQKDPLA